MSTKPCMSSYGKSCNRTLICKPFASSSKPKARVTVRPGSNPFPNKVSIDATLFRASTLALPLESEQRHEQYPNHSALVIRASLPWTNSPENHPSKWSESKQSTNPASYRHNTQGKGDRPILQLFRAQQGPHMKMKVASVGQQT